MSGGEQRTFVFSVIFIVVFAMLVQTIPAGLLGAGETPDMVTPVDPALITDFSETENFTKTDFVTYMYTYDLGARSWICSTNYAQFQLGAKVIYFGTIWLGGLDTCDFIAPSGANRGTILSLVEIEGDATDGVVRYTLQYTTTGNSAGAFIAYWNTTEYEDPGDAFDNDVLYLVHGVGLETSGTDIVSLLLALLFLQLPDVPVLVNVLIIIPVWAGIIYTIWFLIKEMIPFL